MIKFNVILVILIVFFEFIFDWQPYHTVQISTRQPASDATAMVEYSSISAKTDVRAHFVEEIKSKPIFVEERVGIVGEIMSNTTIIIDGMYTPVELIGTIWSEDESTAAFSLGNDEITWFSRNDWLGEWKIDEIQQQFVRISNAREMRILQKRKHEDGALPLDALEPASDKADQ